MKDQLHHSPFEQRLRSCLLPSAPAPDPRYLPSAVLLAITLFHGAPRLIYTRRSMTVATHRGQISFPGGVAEPEDASADAVALREAAEEIGLLPDNVLVVGYMEGMRTITDFWITPVVGMVKADFSPVICEAEVAELFEVPIAELLQTEKWRFEERVHEGVRYNDCRFSYNDKTIWGATGKLTWSLISRLQQTSLSE